MRTPRARTATLFLNFIFAMDLIMHVSNFQMRVLSLSPHPFSLCLLHRSFDRFGLCWFAAIYCHLLDATIISHLQQWFPWNITRSALFSTVFSNTIVFVCADSFVDLANMHRHTLYIRWSQQFDFPGLLSCCLQLAHMILYRFDLSLSHRI